MKNFTMLVHILISLIFSSFISGHPVPNYPCQCGPSSHGTHSIIFTQPETANIQEPVVPASRSAIYYGTFPSAPQTTIQESRPVSQAAMQPVPYGRSGLTYSIIPSTSISQSQPAIPSEPLTLAVEMPATVVQTRVLESPIPQIHPLESSSAPCRSDELTGRTLEFKVESPAVPSPNEVTLETYNTGIQGVVREPVRPVVRTVEQQIQPFMIVQPRPTYMVQEPAPYAAPPRYVTQISAPVVEATPRTGYTEELPRNSLQHIFFHPRESSCSCFKK